MQRRERKYREREEEDKIFMLCPGVRLNCKQVSQVGYVGLLIDGSDHDTWMMIKLCRWIDGGWNIYRGEVVLSVIKDPQPYKTGACKLGPVGPIWREFGEMIY